MIGGRWLLLSLLEMYDCVEIALAGTNGFVLERGISILLAAADRAKLVIGAHLFTFIRLYPSSPSDSSSRCTRDQCLTALSRSPASLALSPNVYNPDTRDMLFR